MDITDERVAELPDFKFAEAASFAAMSLSRYGFAYVQLAPGDSTLYEIAIVRPPTMEQWRRHDWMMANRPDDLPELGDSYFIATGFGPLYRWEGREIGEWTYVFEKWTRARPGTPDEWTARVLLRFINELAKILVDQKESL